MKKILCLALLYSFLEPVNAQKYSLSWGQPLPNDNKSYVLFTAASPVEPFFSLCQSSHLSYVTPLASYTLFKTNDKLTTVLNKDVQEEEKNSSLRVIGIENAGKNVLYFYSSISKASKAVEYMVSVYDQNGALTGTTKLFSHPENESEDYESATVTANASRSKFAVCSRVKNFSGSTYAKMAPKMFVALCDAEGKKLWSKSTTYKSETCGGIYVFDVMVSDEGSVYLAYKKYSAKGNETVKDEAAKKKVAGYSFLVSKFTDGNAAKATSLENGVYVYSAKLLQTSAKQVNCLALFGHENKEAVEGILNAAVDDNGGVVYNKKSDLPSEENILCKNRETYEMDITGAHVAGDGTIYVVSERSSNVHSIDKEYPLRFNSVSAPPNGSTIASYASYGITIFSFDKDGGLLHSKIIPRQFINIVSDFYCGIFSAVIKDKLYLVYNAFQVEAKNNLKSAFGANLSDYGCIVNAVDKDFNVSRKVLYYYTNTSAMVIPTLSFPLQNDQLMLFNGVLRKYGKSNFDLPETFKYSKLNVE